MKNRRPYLVLRAIVATALLTACQETLDERCMREAKTYTEKNCPTEIADDVTIDSLTFDPSTHTLCYAYTLGGLLDDSAVVSKAQLEKQMLADLKNATSLKVYKDAGYSFRYVYYSQKHRGQKLLDAIYREKDYK